MCHFFVPFFLCRLFAPSFCALFTSFVERKSSPGTSDGAREFLKPRKWTWKSERRPSFHRMGSDVDFVPTKGSEDDILLRSLIG